MVHDSDQVVGHLLDGSHRQLRRFSCAALIERQSQEFSDASASGDAATIAKYLDDRVIFMNETGEIGDKKGIVDGTQPTPKNIQHGSVSYVDVAAAFVRLAGDPARTWERKALYFNYAE